MPDAQQLGPPPMPAETVREGSRWRFHAPSSEQVAAWFNTIPLDNEFEGTDHELFVNGVVIIPQSAKVKYQTASGTTDRYEMTYTPYMQIGTRLAYARRLAEARNLVLRIASAIVPRSSKPESPYFNGNMAEGLWWHVVSGQNEDGQQGHVRYLCATQVVQMFEREQVEKAVRHPETNAVVWESMVPVLEGQGTKQVGGGADANGLMKAQTGAIGRALAVAGILVLGTGIASAEDMQEFTATAAAAPELPTTNAPTEVPGKAPTETPEERTEALTALRARALAAETRLDELGAAEGWHNWWTERAANSGWQSINDVPLDALDPIVGRLETAVKQAEPPAVEPAPVQ